MQLTRGVGLLAGHLRVSHVFSSTVLLGRGIEVHAWLWLDCCAFSVYPREGLRRAGLGVWHAKAPHGCLSQKNTHPVTVGIRAKVAQSMVDVVPIVSC